MNFKLNSRIEEKEQNQWIIYIPVKQEIPLIKIVKFYMRESMLYKVQ
jgi:5-formyltetrahydrofolate cyclo-ligase